MYILGIIVVILVPLTAGLILDGGSTKDVLTTETLVKRHGYPFEKHKVQTDDGYILELHRIPYSLESNTSSPRPVAFLMHCLLCSSSDWVVVGPENSLAYILVKAGYDVWMGNARGNTYSRKHIKYNADGLFNDKFWDFSWHQIGISDLPSMLNYVRNNTKVKQLRYFGHSQGTTTFFVLNSMKPEYNKIFKSAHLLAPVAFMSNADADNLFLKLGGPFVGHSNLLQFLMGSTEFRPRKELTTIIGSILCPDFSEDRVLCNNPYFLVAGFTNETVNHTIIPDLMASNPAGSSTNQVLHYVQEFVSGHFRQIEYGVGSNPPDYPLENIDVPIFFYYSLADNFASKKDVIKLSMKLKTIVGKLENPITNFDHLAYMYSPNLAEKVHKHVMKDVASIY